MALTILNNTNALAAENQLNITGNNLSSTLEQLSSGSKINSGADDPAGLAIANGLSANISALTQSSSNATDGVGELQVADGALSQVTTLLDRAVTLATESATGTVSDTQRKALDSEYQSIKAEINSIGSTTNYNGGQVFTSNTLNIFLSDGSTSGSSQIGVATGLLSASTLNMSETPATATLTAASTAATDTITASNAAAAANDTVTIGGRVYTFVNQSAGAVTASAGETVVYYGADQTASMHNLMLAITGGTGAGTLYAYGTGAGAANTQVTATDSTGVLTLSATASGTTGNGITVSANFATAANVAVATPTTSGGLDLNGQAAAGDQVKIGNQTYTFVTAANLNNSTANEVVLGSTEAQSLANLTAAVNGSSGAGTSYSSSTSKNASATAAASQTSITFTALTAGAGGNSIVATATPASAASPDNVMSSSGTAGFFGGGNANNDLLTSSDAQAALTQINSAVATIAALRGNIGGTVNRLQAASNVITVQTQNLTSAENDVTAADIPSTVAKLSSYSILEQTGISALAQANQQQQLVLKLLQ
jgi:flagellin